MEPTTLKDDIISCGTCDGLDCDKCSLFIEKETEDNLQHQMQREDESNYLLYPLI